jgi:hypothetical protein
MLSGNGQSGALELVGDAAVTGPCAEFRTVYVDVHVYVYD